MDSLSESQNRSVQSQDVHQGRGYILAVAVIQLIVACITGAVLANANKDINDQVDPELQNQVSFLGVYILLGISAIFFGLWIWAKSAPFAASLSALIIYLTLVGVNALFDPSSILSGIIFKVFIVIALAKAVQSGYALRQE